MCVLTYFRCVLKYVICLLMFLTTNTCGIQLCRVGLFVLSRSPFLDVYYHTISSSWPPVLPQAFLFSYTESSFERYVEGRFEVQSRPAKYYQRLWGGWVPLMSSSLSGFGALGRFTSRSSWYDGGVPPPQAS